MKNDFKEPKYNESFYNLFDDYALIEASFAQQYGIRLRNEDSMSWDEFANLLSGLNADTPLGRIVSIRAEKDPKTIKNFTPEQKQIHREWQQKRIKTMTKSEFDNSMKELEKYLFESIGSRK